MTRLIKKDDLLSIAGHELKLFFTKENFHPQDIFIAQNDTEETKYEVAGMYQGGGLKSGYELIILSEPTN